MSHLLIPLTLQLSILFGGFHVQLRISENNLFNPQLWGYSLHAVHSFEKKMQLLRILQRKLICRCVVKQKRQAKTVKYVNLITTRH